MKLRIFFPAVLVLLCISCGQDTGTSGMRDGYYTAEAATFDVDGWKEFMTIYVSNNKIVTVEYNAKNSSGFVKSWDVDYMRRMKEKTGVYPNTYSRAYAAELVLKQNPGVIWAIPGARQRHASFRLLAESAMAQARAGDKKVVFVELPSFSKDEAL